MLNSLTKAPEQRTEAGALLRSGLDQIARLPLPEGKRGRAVVVTDLQQVEIGVAWQTARGWRIDASVSAAIRGGRAVRAAVSAEW